MDTVTGSLMARATVMVYPAVARLAVAGFPSPTAAGNPGDFTVTGQDANGNTVPNFRGDLLFSSDDPQATLPNGQAFYRWDAGVYYVSATLRTAGNHNLTVLDRTTGAQGTQNGIVVNPAAAVTLGATGFPSPVTAGVAGIITITARDAYGNTATGYRGTTHFSSTDPQATLPADYPFAAGDGGVHAFNVTLKTAGSRAVTATDTTTGSITGTQAGIVVNPAATSILAVTGFPSPTTAGVAGNVTVTAKDPFGNVTPAYSGTVHFSSSDPQAVLPADYTFTAADNGTHTLSATLVTATVQTLTATDTAHPGINGIQANIAVSPAAADHLQLDAPANVTAGTSFDLTLTALDPYNNIDVNYAGTVTFGSTDPGAALPGDYTFMGVDGGVHQFPAGSTLVTAGGQAVTATDVNTGQLAGNVGVTVSPAAADHFAIDLPAAVASGTAFDGAVTALDPFGNIDTNYRSTVTFATSDGDPGVVLPGDYPFSADDNGVHLFAGGFTLITVGDQVLTATDTVTGIAGNAVVTVTAPAGVPGLRGRSGFGVGAVPAVPALASPGRPAAPDTPHTPAPALGASGVEWFFAATDAEGSRDARTGGAIQEALPLLPVDWPADLFALTPRNL